MNVPGTVNADGGNVNFADNVHVEKKYEMHKPTFVRSVHQTQHVTHVTQIPETGFTRIKGRQTMFVCWLLNVPATCECISGTDLHRQFYVLPH